MKKFVPLMAMLCLCVYTTYAEGGEEEKKIGRKYNEKIKVDLLHGSLPEGNSLPFDVPFTFYGEIAPEVTEVLVSYKTANGTTDTAGIWKRYFITPRDTQDTFYVNAPSLKPNTSYTFTFSLKRKYTREESWNIYHKTKADLWEGTASIIANNSTTANLTANQIKIKLVESFMEKLNNHIEEEFAQYGLKINAQTQYKHSASEIVHQSLDFALLSSHIYNINQQFITLEQDREGVAGKWKKFRSAAHVLAGKKLPANDSVFIAKVSTDPSSINSERCLSGTRNFDTDQNTVFNNLYTAPDSINCMTVIENKKSLLNKLTSVYRAVYSTYTARDRSDMLSSINNLIDAMERSISISEKIAAEINYCNALIRKVKIDTYMNNIIQLRNIDISESNTTEDFITRAEYYITADFGLAYTFFKTGDLIPYAGVNFNFWPINRQARYKTKNFQHMKHPWWYVQSKKISMVAGITLTSINKTENNIDVRTGLVGTDSKYGMMTGFAYRLGDYGRISAGTVFARVKTGDLLVNQDKLSVFPYIAISLDLDVKKNLQKLGELIFPGL